MPSKWSNEFGTGRGTSFEGPWTWLPSKHGRHAHGTSTPSDRWCLGEWPLSLENFLDECGDLCRQHELSEERMATSLARYALNLNVRALWWLLAKESAISSSWDPYRDVLVENTPGAGAQHRYLMGIPKVTNIALAAPIDDFEDDLDDPKPRTQRNAMLAATPLSTIPNRDAYTSEMSSSAEPSRRRAHASRHCSHQDHQSVHGQYQQEFMPRLRDE
ncbi:hypothetical protein NMY22_g8806 [Coprinellus aureogranulatus]|nr:hypothetical protein NMY22_g8806 [Coprinellus aureogranulatus]